MVKRYTLLITLVVLLLTSCAPTALTEEPSQTEALPPAPAVEETAAPAETASVSQEGSAVPGCTVTSVRSTPDATQESIFPPVSEADWVSGPDSAYVTFVEYSDFQCPYCAQLAPILKELQAQYPEDLRVAFRHYPLVSIHDKAALSAQAADAAGEQGKFWEMHDLLFENQQEWSGFSIEEFTSWVIESAGELDLDVEKFSEDLNSEELAARAQEAWERNSSIGIPGTPFLLINDQYYNGPISYGNLDAIIKMILLEKRQYSACPPMEIDPARTYIATLHTEKGDIVIELLPDVAPLAVNSFVFLAREGWFDGVTFHRVIPRFVAQGGDPSGTGLGGPGYAFKNEVSEDLKFDSAGLVAMANSGPDTNGSQFFITLGEAPHLNGGYTIFGRVISGMEVAESLTPRDPAQSMTLPPGDRIESVTIEEK